MGRKLGRGLGPLFGEGTGWLPIEHKILWAEACLHTKWHRDVSSRLGTINMGRKFGGLGLRPLFGEGLCPHLTQSPLG